MFIETAKGVNLFVNDVGAGTPVIFLHGWPVNNNMFEYQLNTLPAEGIRYIGVDMRGYGQSDKPWDGYDYDTMADDVKAIIDELGVKDAVLVGFSMGGAIAIRYMARHNGHGIAKLVLAGAAAPVFTQRNDYPYGLTKQEVNDIIDSACKDRPAMLENFGGMFYSSKPSNPFNQWFMSLGLQAGGHSTIKSAVALRDEDLRGDLDKVLVPTVIFHGKNDKVCPYEFAGEMNKGIANSRIVPFQNSGHGSFYDEREKFNQELLVFLKS
ncbi:alpha/beta fold hydrolase [Domibacillus iocasae]|uniref:Alpha/beta hydrolase n=1 Tax=Domibacillus iocasae TaxID=1714016 RepID=A0A1E7DTM5_9BACI|nr:alpha/beta hydrolase [Domibacillus iocasae]OES46433.1 alpha/beta hydrolase [Domibacillus iocasae]